MRLHTNNHENDNKMSDSGDDWEKQLEDEDELEKQLKKAEEEIKPIMMKMYSATSEKPGDIPMPTGDEGKMPGMHGQDGPRVEEVD